jgi:hypothetical protein
MKKLLILFIVLLVCGSFKASEGKLEDCKCNGIVLFGKVRVVEYGETFKVRISEFPDLRVKKTFFPSQCGEWEFVEGGEDFTVRYVEIGEDFTIKFDDFPGITQ